MPPPFPPLYAILDVAAVNSEARIPEALAENGVSLIQVRDKDLRARALFEASKALVARLSRKDVRVIVNDRPDIAAMAGAGGVHVGQDDLPVEAARACCGGDLWVGVSTHNLKQFQQATTTPGVVSKHGDIGIRVANFDRDTGLKKPQPFECPATFNKSGGRQRSKRAAELQGFR